LSVRAEAVRGFYIRQSESDCEKFLVTLSKRVTKKLGVALKATRSLDYAWDDREVARDDREVARDDRQSYLDLMV